ncbi:diguanylate cyclase [Mycobacterium sp. PS03-16]|uniref:GGDEF domain-containing protein n=1 Tax=Mycobacterium sp. PS03-16 TaxID=2559611 RepID=UPI001FD85198|nr:GGDEF domain-containing protein [Mycobacterium sp. PS03-16]
MTTSVRLMMALIAASLTACLLALLRFDGPVGALPVAMMWAAVACGVAGVALWTWRWPSHAQSLAFAVVSNAAIALACLAYPDPQGALTGCISFATIAAYIAFFHSTVLVLYNFVVATAVGVVAALRLAWEGHTALAAVDLLLVVQINIAMPVAIHVIVRSLGIDLVEADRDSLTGLLNRRAFDQQASKMVGSRTTGGHLIVALVDLDKFKQINDTYGHQAGDEALIAVARALRHAMVGVPTVIGRCGGEEFVVAAVYPTSDPTSIAARICEEIAALPQSVTASVGTAGMAVGPAIRDRAGLHSLARLVRAADAAMYRAKRAGGNRHEHHTEPPSRHAINSVPSLPKS